MADEALTADEKRQAQELRIDSAVRAKLTCPGCHKPLVPVAHRGYRHWTCPTFGCSRMIGPAVVEGWVNAILATEGAAGGGAKSAVRRYEKGLADKTGE